MGQCRWSEAVETHALDHLQCGRSVAVETDAMDPLPCRRSVAVETDAEVKAPVNPMDYVYDTALDIVGDGVLDASELVGECYQRVDEALQEWLDYYRITDECAGVQKVNDEIIFCGLGAAKCIGP